MVTTGPQANAEIESASPGVLVQLLRFVLIGGFCGLLDLATYQGLRALGMDSAPLVDVARACSFVVGTTAAYFLNRRFTFAAGHRGSVGQISGYALLYTTTFFVAVGVNRLMLVVLPAIGWKGTLAWAVSQATATAINFVMLKWVVFREPRT